MSTALPATAPEPLKTSFGAPSPGFGAALTGAFSRSTPAASEDSMAAAESGGGGGGIFKGMYFTVVAVAKDADLALRASQTFRWGVRRGERDRGGL